MNWTKIKTLLIIILAAANIFFLFLIAMYTKSANYIDSDSLQEAEIILARDGIIIESGAVPKKKLTSSVYTGKYDEEYYGSVVRSIRGTDNFMTRMTISFISIIMNDTRETFEFYDNFAFVYNMYGQDEDNGYAKLASGELAADGNISGKRKIMSAVESFFGDINATDSFKTEYISFHEIGELKAVKLRQTIGGMPIYGNETLCLIEDGELVYAEGVWQFISPENSYQTDLYDQITALFFDKSYIDELEIGGSVLKGMKGSYCLYWNGNKTEYYLIPAWILSYGDGSERAYNAINGQLYAHR